MKAAFNFLNLTNPSSDDEREIDQRKFVDAEGDIVDESDVELDGNDLPDLLSDSEDRAGSAEYFR